MYCSFLDQVSLYSLMWGKGHQVKSCLGQQIGQSRPWLVTQNDSLLELYITRDENQNVISAILGEVYIYIQWKLLMSFFYWQKYTFIHEYTFLY